MSIYQKASLVQIPSGYKASGAKLYSVLPANGDGDFTVSSDADATRVNSDGLVESTSANQARLNYDFDNPQDPHLLLEPTRTNYCLNSNNANSWNTFTSNGTITRTANYATAPDGSQTATRFQGSVTGSGYAMLFPLTNSISGNYSLSVYVKSNTGSNQSVAFYGRNTALSNYTVTNEWQRLELSGSQTGVESSYFLLGINTSVGTPSNPADILVWGGQLEAGTYATSLIPTTSPAVTRTKDACLNSGDANLFNDSEGTVFIDTTAFKYEALERITLSDSSASNMLLIGKNNATTLQFIVISSGSTVVGQNFTFDYTQRNKIAFRYKQNDFKLYLNGVAVITDTSGNTPTGLNDFSFSGISNAYNWSGKIHQAIYFDTALTDSELQTLTS